MPTNTAAVPIGSRMTSSATSETRKVSRIFPVGSQYSCSADRKDVNELVDDVATDDKRLRGSLSFSKCAPGNTEAGQTQRNLS
jgi:hypothetical protein